MKITLGFKILMLSCYIGKLKALGWTNVPVKERSIWIMYFEEFLQMESIIFYA